MATDTAEQARSVISGSEEFTAGLNPDTLSALMRSTWTWDDRALRRDLSALLVQLTAARGDIRDEVFATALRASALATGARFVATVLGPHLLADLGNPYRAQFLAAASDPAVFDRAAHQVRRGMGARAIEYLRSLAHGNEHPDESSWLALANTEGAAGVGRAMRADGYTLASTSFFSNVALGLQTLWAVGAGGSGHACRVQQGEVRATLAVAEQAGSWDPALVRTKAVRTGNGWTVAGTKCFVPDAAGVDLILTVARSVAGPSLFAVDATAPGVTITEVATIDATRPLFSVAFDGASAQLLGVEGRGGALMRESIDLAMTALAAEQVGLIERAIDLLLRREADKQRDEDLVSVALDHAAAVSLYNRALDPAADPGAAAMAHIGCSEAALRVARRMTKLSDDTDDCGNATTIQRRALSTSLFLGGPAAYHERLLERLGI